MCSGRPIYTNVRCCYYAKVAKYLPCTKHWQNANLLEATLLHILRCGIYISIKQSDQIRMVLAFAHVSCIREYTAIKYTKILLDVATSGICIVSKQRINVFVIYFDTIAMPCDVWKYISVGSVIE